ncbi:class I SAM-dependent methyltransferase [Anaerobacillus alkaliphilus]|uniref:Class I SAM-dependent methyltransferase n=1 Tax=Anaerobacillus alkaliphilus TaxID=1548597 RepID=A0A4Q0VU07_9BACI|nr:class I SAM-dependent methyltransferase [Anaerobacillus alkaliphilus]RXJ01769.1 class I SAM-dependent methyltransferase [Anaerobacillus alkaliphilus]
MLKDTGERMIPKELDSTNASLLEHTARYYFSTPYVEGRVLDIACGTGYGSQMVAKVKKKEITEMIGVDIDEDTLKYAKANYYHPSLKFEQGDVMDPSLPEKLGSFDVIMSFETIEHVEDDQLFMKNMYSLLKPGGTLILSTPFGKGRGVPCGQPFHFHQLTKEEFSTLFKDFSDVEIYFQRGVTIEPPRKDVHYPIGVAVAIK